MTAKPYGIQIERRCSAGETVVSWARVTAVGGLARYATMGEAEAAAGRFRDRGFNATAQPFGEMAEDGDDQ